METGAAINATFTVRLCVAVMVMVMVMVTMRLNVTQEFWKQYSTG